MIPTVDFRKTLHIATLLGTILVAMTKVFITVVVYLLFIRVVTAIQSSCLIVIK